MASYFTFENKITVVFNKLRRRQITIQEKNSTDDESSKEDGYESISVFTAPLDSGNVYEDAESMFRYVMDELNSCGIHVLDRRIVDLSVNLAATFCDLCLLRNKGNVTDMSLQDDHLEKCINLLDKKEVSESARLGLVRAVIKAFNHLGLVCLEKGIPDKALHLLQRAEQVYTKNEAMKVTPPEVEPATVDPLPFGEDKEEKIIMKETETTIEKAHAMTYAYLSRVCAQYRTTMDSKVNSASNYHTMLNVSLKFLNGVEWAPLAATFAKMLHDDLGTFLAARHHLGAASFMLDEYEESLNTNRDEETAQQMKKIRTVRAQVAQKWADYGIALMQASKKHLKERIKNRVRVPGENASFLMENLKLYNLPTMQFSKIAAEIEEAVKDIPFTYLVTPEEASVVWERTRKALNVGALPFYREFRSDNEDEYTNIIKQIKENIDEADMAHKKLQKVINEFKKLFSKSTNTLELTSN